MATVRFKSAETLETVAARLKKALDPTYVVSIKPKFVRISQGGAKGCIIRLRENDGGTQATLYGYMPSMAFRLAVLLGIFGVFTAAISLVTGELYFSVGGIIPIFLGIFIMKIPSRKLVGEIRQAMLSSDNSA